MKTTLLRDSTRKYLPGNGWMKELSLMMPLQIVRMRDSGIGNLLEICRSRYYPAVEPGSVNLGFLISASRLSMPSMIMTINDHLCRSNRQEKKRERKNSRSRRGMQTWHVKMWQVGDFIADPITRFTRSKTSSVGRSACSDCDPGMAHFFTCQGKSENSR